MIIVYVPLDERPCNYLYPQGIARLQPSIRLVVPPPHFLGQKKQAADVDGLWQWLFETVQRSDYAILSLEMLIYGGLLPSRLHSFSREELSDRLQRFRRLKQQSSETSLFASNLIMRTPTYDSGEEEPDYYEDFGERIFRWGWLIDKQARIGLDKEEQQQLALLQRQVPPEYLNDYRDRRRKNLEVNQIALEMAAEGVFDYLAIPQDDCAEFGFTASDREKVYQQIQLEGLEDKVPVYPGADEVGCSLLARAYGEATGRVTKLFPLFRSEQGARSIPLYEDRSIADSVGLHIQAAGGEVVSTMDEANVVLAVNTPYGAMIEAKEQFALSREDDRQLSEFANHICEQLAVGREIAVADVAFANGGDTELVTVLDRGGYWDRLLAYGGWNTCCNTLGCTIATAILGAESQESKAIAFNIMYRLLDDWGYQSVVRWGLLEDFLPTIGASYYDFNGQVGAVNGEMAERLMQLWDSTFVNSWQHWEIKNLGVFSPWQRMFEIGLNFAIEPS
ncbi:MAG: DUF4127 family protein [Synechococcus sp.]